VRVPLVVQGEGIERGRRVAPPVSLLDVAPTILAHVGAPAPPAFEGRSLLSALRGEAEPAGARDVLLELAPKDRVREVRAHSQGLVRGTRKLLVDPKGEPRLFDLSHDPGERGPGEPESEARDLAAALARERAALETRAGPGAPSEPLDEKTRAELRALGYLPAPEPAPRPAANDHP
jgi:arylsulfatase A-like enzyme